MMPANVFDGSALPSPSRERTMDEINRLVQRLPPNEKEQIELEMRRCRTETQIAGLPIAALVMGGSYLARRALNIGQGAMPFYTLLGVGTMTLYGLVCGSSCSATLRNKLDEFEKMGDQSRFATTLPVEAEMPNQESNWAQPTFISGTPTNPKMEMEATTEQNDDKFL